MRNERARAVSVALQDFFADVDLRAQARFQTAVRYEMRASIPTPEAERREALEQCFERLTDEELETFFRLLHKARSERTEDLHQ